MTRPIRVMHVVLSLSPGGAERLVIDLSRRLHPVVPTSICCLDDAGAWADDVRADGIPVDVLARQPGFHPGLGLRIADLAGRYEAGIVHCHQYSPFVYATIAGLRRPSLCIVYTEHGRLTDAPPSRKRAAVNRVLGRRCDVIIAVSRELRGHMLAEGFSSSRVQVIHNGVEPGAVVTSADAARAKQALGLPEDAWVVGTIARFDPVKQLDILIDAFAAVARAVPEARLVMVGGGPEGQRLEGLVGERGLTDLVVFTGVRRGARALMPGFDVYVNTSVSEGISLTLLEAMAASRPVVATRVGGTPEVIADGSTGLLVPANDVQSVVEAIISLRQDAAKRMSLGAAARTRVIEHFSLDRMARDYLAAYRGCRGEN
jgi:L-malate glycosyltransferase